MKTVVHKAADRGIQDHGWLKAAHSFSFANYFDPAKTHFGLLRVLNDDVVAPGMGFGMHGHDNMEIVTIPLKGKLAHKDSLGSEGVITPGEVQIMSAGSGIKHSEFNGSQDEEVNLLQIWVFPKERNINPRYDQKKIDQAPNAFTTLVSPAQEGDSMWINQDARFVMGNLDAGKELEYTIKHDGNGAYVFVIEGSVELDGKTYGRRDAAGISDTGSFKVKAGTGTRFLVIEVPMN